MNEQGYTHAQFWKCALQVDSYTYGSEYRVQDHGMDAKTCAEAARSQ